MFEWIQTEAGQQQQQQQRKKNYVHSYANYIMRSTVGFPYMLDQCEYATCTESNITRAYVRLLLFLPPRMCRSTLQLIRTHPGTYTYTHMHMYLTSCRAIKVSGEVSTHMQMCAC